MTATIEKPKTTKRPKSRKPKSARKKPYEARLYLGRDPETGKQLFDYLGHFAKKRERDQAVAEARAKRDRKKAGELPLIAVYVAGYLRDYKKRNKFSSWDSTRERLKPFVEEFGTRRMDEISRREAKDWIAGEGEWEGEGARRSGTTQSCVTLFNHAADEDDLELPRNPFRKLGKRTRGRADEPPPTPEEFEKLLDACSALGEYGPRFRAFMLFAAMTLMRPGELYVLEWTKIDAAAARIRKQYRLYRGDVDEPKYGKATIYLPPPALEAISGLPRDSRYVFTSKTGRRLSQSTLSGYWAIVKAAAGLDFDFYHSTKHYGVHFLWTRLHVPRRGIAAQAGWSERTVDKMLEIYGHGEVGALREVEEAWASTTVKVPPAWVSTEDGEGGDEAPPPADPAPPSRSVRGSLHLRRPEGTARTGTEQRYVLTPLGAGDYLLPSNDGRTLWRIRRYTEGPSTGLDWPRDREVWGIWRWLHRIEGGGQGQYLDPDDDSREFMEGLCDKRSEAIDAALRLG